ncbi:MAG: sulfurtransferase TusA family protein [Gammaproteobacteria bacterium]
MGLFGRKTAEHKPAPGGEVRLESGEVVKVTANVDCIGDSCPRPQLLTRGALAEASPGDIIQVDVDNPTSMEALPPIITENGGSHLATLRQPRHWQVLMRKN